MSDQVPRILYTGRRGAPRMYCCDRSQGRQLQSHSALSSRFLELPNARWVLLREREIFPGAAFPVAPYSSGVPFSPALFGILGQSS